MQTRMKCNQSDPKRVVQSMLIVSSILVLVTVRCVSATNVNITTSTVSNTTVLTTAPSVANTTAPEPQPIHRIPDGSVLSIIFAVTIGFAVLCGVTGCIVCGVCRRKQTVDQQ